MTIPTSDFIPDHVNPIEWQQSIGIARQTCARIFRDGGSPADALEVFGLDVGDGPLDWSRAVDLVAHSLSTRRPQLRCAA